MLTKQNYYVTTRKKSPYIKSSAVYMFPDIRITTIPGCLAVRMVVSSYIFRERKEFVLRGAPLKMSL